MSRPATTWDRRGRRSDWRTLLIDAGVTEIPVLDIDNVNVGPYIRNTMAVDKNMNRDRSADGHLPRHAPGRAADRRGRAETLFIRCSSIRSATTCRPWAA
jgi:hypothetical protein